MINRSIASRSFLSRRALLRGAGITLALPFLESIAPRAVVAAEIAAPPPRRLDRTRRTDRSAFWRSVAHGARPRALLALRTRASA